MATLAVPKHKRWVGPKAMKPAWQPKLHVVPSVRPMQAEHGAVALTSSKNASDCAKRPAWPSWNVLSVVTSCCTPSTVTLMVGPVRSTRTVWKTSDEASRLLTKLSTTGSPLTRRTTEMVRRCTSSSARSRLKLSRARNMRPATVCVLTRTLNDRLTAAPTFALASARCMAAAQDAGEEAWSWPSAWNHTAPGGGEAVGMPSSCSQGLSETKLLSEPSRLKESAKNVCKHKDALAGGARSGHGGAHTSGGLSQAAPVQVEEAEPETGTQPGLQTCVQT